MFCHVLSHTSKPVFITGIVKSIALITSGYRGQEIRRHVSTWNLCAAIKIIHCSAAIAREVGEACGTIVTVDLCMQPPQPSAFLAGILGVDNNHGNSTAHMREQDPVAHLILAVLTLEAGPAALLGAW